MGKIKKMPNNNKLCAWVLQDENLLQQSMHRALQLITKVPKEKNALTHRYQHLNGIILLCSGENYKWVSYTPNLCIVTH
jgi:hypothetical protein